LSVTEVWQLVESSKSIITFYVYKYNILKMLTRK